MEDIITIDEGDKIACYIPLRPNKNKHAVIWKDDFDFLLKLGVSRKWSTVGKNRNNVISGEHSLIGRILTNAKAGERVTYIDGNKLNLRRDNLRVEIGGSSVRHALSKLVG